MPAMPGPLRLRTKEENLTIVDRLKKLEKKDWAAVGVCLLLLGVLPVVEHVMNRPADDGVLKPGWAVPGAEGDGSEDLLYEPGAGLGAPGSAPGENTGEIITPLPGRDPTSLVTGLGSPQRSSQQSAPPPGPSANEQRLRDALAEAARRSLPEANKSAGLPKPTAKLSTTLTNAFGGGAGMGAGGRGIGTPADAAALQAAKNVPGKPGDKPSGLDGVSKPPEFKGMGIRSPASASEGELERLKAQADKQAGQFTRARASEALDESVKATPTAGGGDSASGAGLAGEGKGSDPSKMPGNPGDRGQRNFGVGLEQQKKMALWNKALEDCYKKRDAVANSASASVVSGFGLLGSSQIDCTDPEHPKGPLWASHGTIQAIDKAFNEKIVGDALMGTLADKLKDKWSGKDPLGEAKVCTISLDGGGVIWAIPGKAGVESANCNATGNKLTIVRCSKKGEKSCEDRYKDEVSGKGCSCSKGSEDEKKEDPGTDRMAELRLTAGSLAEECKQARAKEQAADAANKAAAKAAADKVCAQADAAALLLGTGAQLDQGQKKTEEKIAPKEEEIKKKADEITKGQETVAAIDKEIKKVEEANATKPSDAHVRELNRLRGLKSNYEGRIKSLEDENKRLASEVMALKMGWSSVCGEKVRAYFTEKRKSGAYSAVGYETESIRKAEDDMARVCSPAMIGPAK